jgi:hypothetical protein
MSHESETLADTPALFWRFDMVGPPTNGDEVEDLSGNDLHGTLEYIQSGGAIVAYGYPSPIESDAGSFEFRGFTAGVFGTTQVVRFGRAADALIEPAGDFSLEGWLRLPSATGGSAQFGTIMQQMFGRTGGTFIYIDNFSHLAGCVVDIAGTGWLVIDPDPVVYGLSYKVTMERVGNALVLYVNGAVRDTTTITSGLPNRMNAPGTFLNANGVTQPLPGFFVHPFQIAALDARYDEVVYFTHSTGAARVLTRYEAALNATLLNGFSNVIPSAILYSDIEPDPISFPFRHNWADDLIERLSFATGISTAVKGYEQANGQRISPRREIEITQVLRDDAERRTLRAKLNANQHRKWFWPILEDRDRLTTPIASGTSVFAIDTLYKDYEVGGYFGLRQLNDAGQVTASEELLITALTNVQITTATPTVNEYPNPEVYPVRRAIIEASIALRGHTDSVEDLTILARLIAEDEAIIPHRIVEWTPAISYKSHEVFPVAQWPNDWSELRDYEVQRVREDVDFETGQFTAESDAIGASETFSWRIILDTKQKQAQFFGWFYARAGSLNYLWVPSMQRDFATVSALSNDLTVSAHNYFDNYAASEFRRDLAFVYNDNSLILRRINAVALDGVNEVLTLDSTVPTFTNLRSVSYLLFCRLDNDTLERASATDNKARFAWLFREVLSSPA